jgi:sugar lactone lactonase YvrE
VPVVVEFGTNKVATVDPKTMAIKEYTLPRAAARPRRLAIGADGMVWYVDFAGGQLGRLDLATGEVKEWPSPSGAKSEPYGIVFTKGALWYSESAAKPNTIVRFDPASEKFQSWAIPGGGDIVRNMDVTRDGNPVTATFADYGIPSAAELPSFTLLDMATPTHLNPLGVKGIGEAGTIGATPAAQSAVIDALAHLGVRHIDMPLTPLRVWEAIEGAK